MPQGQKWRINRRRALSGMAAAVVGASFPPRRSWGQAPSEELRVASVGCGGKGWSDVMSVATAPKVRIVALCDVDDGNLKRAHAQFGQAETYRDYRRLFDEMRRDIDAVIISTPDHMHGSIALAAMSLGKHVYVQKPLAHNLVELRRMRDVAESTGVVTQMGTQIHSHEAYLTAAQLLRTGAIGKVSEVHFWVGKVWAGPAEGRPKGGQAPPADLEWNLWLGVAPDRPYVAGLYHPDNWRGWRDFGTGTLGDMGCHLFDPIFAGLNLAAPIEVISRASEHRPETYSPDSDISLTFSGTPHTAERVKFHWTNGSIKPEFGRNHLPKDLALPDSGSFIVGEKCAMLLPHVNLPTFYRGGQKLDLSVDIHAGRNHYHEWVGACRGDGATSTPFSYGCPVTEAVLLGLISGNFRNQPLKWNSKSLSLDNANASALISRSYRDGWSFQH